MELYLTSLVTILTILKLQDQIMEHAAGIVLFRIQHRVKIADIVQVGVQGDQFETWHGSRHEHGVM